MNSPDLQTLDRIRRNPKVVRVDWCPAGLLVVLCRGWTFSPGHDTRSGICLSFEQAETKIREATKFEGPMNDETELRDLERRLAFIAAKEQVERTENKGWQWHNTKHITAIVGAPALADAIRYLDLRGLLERKPDAPHLVRVKEES